MYAADPLDGSVAAFELPAPGTAFERPATSEQHRIVTNEARLHG